MLIVKRAIRAQEQAFILPLVQVVRVLSMSSLLLDKLIDPVTVPKLFEIFNEALKFAEPAIEVCILQTLRLLFNNLQGREHVLKNEAMLSYAVRSLAKENVNIANEAAAFLIEVLQEPRKAFTWR